MIKIHQDELFSILRSEVSTAIDQMFCMAFAHEKIKITNEQLLVMICLWEKDRVTQQTLCNQTHMNKPSMTRLIDKLEKDKLTRRVSDRGDRRINLICLTELGIALESKASGIIHQIIEISLKNITEDEFDIFRIVFKKIVLNVVTKSIKNKL
jgi:DNA-binding MarR family transcriptional regulator